MKISKEKELKLQIKHIENAKPDCECRICFKQETGTYLDGLREAIQD